MLQIAIDRKQFVAPASSAKALHVALEDVRFGLAEGSFSCLVGPSGCGKSTMLNIINGLDSDYQGSVALNGSAPVGGIATMFQTPRLMPWLSVLDNVRLVLAEDDVDSERAAGLLAAMELGDVLDAYPSQLSGGMQRRVALARAFVINPRLLLMDEPFVSLDLPVANRLRTMLIELWQRQQATVLFVTHDLREALALGDRVLFMSGSPGRVVLDLPIELPRPRGVDDAAVTELQQQLMRQHPDLLAGLIGESA